MKRLLSSLILLCALVCNAQTTITTHSSCDSDCDGEVTVVDATNTVNKVIKKAASETQVVTAEQLNTILNEINTKLDELNSLRNDVNTLKITLSELAKKEGTRSFEEIEDSIKYGVHEYVDLGLPSGTLWATCNLGAEKPEDYGYYIAFGENGTEEDGYLNGVKTAGYKWSTLKYCTGSTCNGPFTKYVNQSFRGTIDNRTTLEACDDAATMNWGEKWHTPTYEQLNELVTECTWQWLDESNSEYNGVVGYKVIGKSNNHIFLPAAGNINDEGYFAVGEWCEYLSSSLYATNSNGSISLYIYNTGTHEIHLDFTERDFGLSVRPVCK